MTVLARILKITACALLSLVLIAAIAFGCLVAANRHDDPLGEAAQQALQYAMPTEQALQDNGYLIVAGMDAPDNGSPTANAMALGRQRLERAVERLLWKHQPGSKNMADIPPWIAQNDGYTKALPALQCPKEHTDCFAWYVEQKAQVQALLQRNQVLLARYRAAANAAQFSDPFPYDFVGPLPPYSLMSNIHSLLLAQAALQWMEQRPAQALTTVELAARLRSRLGSSSKGLIESSFALAMQYRELRWVSQAISHSDTAPPAAIAARIQALLAQPLPPLHDAMATEKQAAIATIVLTQHHTSSDYLVPDRDVLAEPRLWILLLDRITGRGYLPIATINDTLRLMDLPQAMGDLPAGQLAKAVDDGELPQRIAQQCSLRAGLRNSVGRCMQAHSTPNLLQYFLRVHDIEGYRRLVLLQAQAQAQKVTLAQMPAWLATSPPRLHNPYTLQAMQWDATNNRLIFEGHERQSQHPQASPTYQIRLSP